jgi:bacterioferritin
VAATRKRKEDSIIDVLNSILETELAGVVRYMHYSLMIFGYSRIPIVKWMREQAEESLAHAAAAGEHITALGGHPSLKIGKLLETFHHDINQILREAMDHEREGAALYRKLLELVKDRNIALEEYSRSMVAGEETHINEIEKMLRHPAALDLRPGRS